MISNQPGLFDAPDTPTSAPQRIEEMVISEQQVELLRQAFAQAKIDDMAERQTIIQSCTTRPIANIRQLYAREVGAVLRRIASVSSADVATTGSAWDNREEDTWIDKL
ncbi:hypothetical protein OIU93_03820 [Paeniglutamicibacter sp. ZC-3]|uniref:hypothetical protein n=1 Tax=Paeniglutamicibacter sp. ZC-3 TaxID=2986919 RepID=UPI0021F6A97E|nr:hypothetical protein [Paeniglutamicibacter sp. ZC-3]MCV9993423.1 hypothetical protein [Paeniglutamicibacter sp. ZC-3]